MLQVGRRWAASVGEADNETDATPLKDNSLCCWPGYGLELVDGVVGSSVAAGTDEVGTCWGGPEGAVGLTSGRSRQSLPAGGRWGVEHDCGGGSWPGCDKGGEQKEAWVGSSVSGCSVDVDGSPCHMDPWLHLPGLGTEEAWLDCERVLTLSEPAYLGYYPPAGFDGDWG